MSKYLDDIWEGTSIMSDISCQLRILSRAFYQVGNAFTGDELIDLSEQLDEAKKTISNAVSVEINSSLKRVQGETSKIITQVLENCLDKSKEVI